MAYELWVLVLTTLMLLVLYLVQGGYTTFTAAQWGVGARDNAREPAVFAGRAERTVRNHVEALLVFAPLVLVAQQLGISNGMTVSGAGLFMGARVLYVPLYLLGVPYVRTLAWFAGVIGTGMIGYAVLTAG